MLTRTMTPTIILVSAMSLAFTVAATGDLCLQDFCPSQKFCKRAGPEIVLDAFEQGVPCCLPCSCEPDCVNIGNCCPDIGDVGPPARPLECFLPVANPDVKLLDAEFRKTNTDVKRYWVVVSCPDGTRSDEMVFRCEKKLAEYPEDLLMVADTLGHLFKNEFCARCNGVEAFTTWQLHMQSEISQVLHSYEPTVPFSEFGQVMFWSESPDPDAFEDSRCFASIDSCNETGFWRGPENPILEEMCKDVSLYYKNFNSMFGILFIYKNPFCYMCNSNTETFISDLFCNYTFDDTPFRPDFRITAVLGGHMKTKPTYDGEDHVHVCDAKGVYDPIFDKCRELVCPTYFTPWHGQCQMKYDKVMGVKLAVTLVAHVTIAEPSQFAVIRSKRKDILSLIEDTLSLTKCTRCDNFEWDQQRNEELRLAFQVVYRIERQCNMTFLMSIFLDFLEKELYLQTDIGNVRISPRLLPGDTDLRGMGFRGILAGVSLYCPDTVIDFKCPRLKFTKAELERLNTTSRRAQKPNIIEGKNGEVESAICLKEYQAMTTAGCPVAVGAAPRIIGFLVCVTSLVFQ